MLGSDPSFNPPHFSLHREGYVRILCLVVGRKTEIKAINQLLKFLERACLVAGFSLIAVATAAHVDAMAHKQIAVDEFERIRSSIASPNDQADWSETRKAGYQEAMLRDAGETLAVLRIPASNIVVPVFDSTSGLALNRGAGHVSGTALPGEPGNVAIAAHRDGFFRGLNDIQIGDEIELTTLEGQQVYRVAELDIVDPLDVSVLEPTNASIITLITCYPFYYVGAAPDRFIVRATLE